MFWKHLFERTSASLLALLFLLFSISSGIAMASPVHASSMPVTDLQDHSMHAGYNSEGTDKKLVQQSDKTATTGQTNNACAALCQTNTTNKSTSSLPISEKEEDDETFDEEVINQNVCLQATNDPEPVYEDRVLKVPLYLKNCLLRL